MRTMTSREIKDAYSVISKRDFLKQLKSIKKKRLRDEHIRTYTGKKFHIFNPKPREIDIIDIAHASSMNCRFNSHTRSFYSVGSHLVIGAKLIADEFKKQYLVHDFSETYIGDLVTPIKRRNKAYIRMERRIERIINKKYGLPFPMAPEVKDMDNLMFRMESTYLMNNKTYAKEKFPLTKRQFMKEINKTPRQVERELLNMFNKLFR